jgi:uncharacterized delta-60 repeat protein
MAVTADHATVVGYDAGNEIAPTFVAAAFTLDGRPDFAFGSQGILVVHGFYGRLVAVDAQGRIYAGDNSFASSSITNPGFQVLRLASNGMLSPDFGPDDNGTVVLPLAPDAYVEALVADRAGGLFVGHETVAQSPNYRPKVLVQRLQASGLFDSYYGERGAAHTRFAFSNGPNSLALQSDDKLLVTGLSYSTGYAFVDRFRPDGVRDHGFGHDGRFTIPEAKRSKLVPRIDAILPASDRRITLVITGVNSQGLLEDFTHLEFVRLNQDGRLDARFGDGGIVGEPFRRFATFTPTAAAVDQQGRLVVAGTRESRPLCGTAELLRLDRNGHPDPTFGSDGVVIGGAFPPGACTDVTNMAVLGDGSILVAATVGQDPTRQLALARYRG